MRDRKRRIRAFLLPLAVAMLLTGGFGIGLAPIAFADASRSVSSGTITLDGAPVAVHITHAGQTTRLAFSGASGQRISVVVSHSTVGSDCPAVVMSLRRPDGSQLGAATAICNGSGFLDTRTLDRAGSWNVSLAPQGQNVGHLTVQAYAVTDQVGTIARNGEPVAVSLTTPGERARFSFSSVAGQQVSSTLSNATFGDTCGAARLSLLSPDGTQFGPAVSTCKARAFLDGQRLDADGDWSLLVDPIGARTGTADLIAYNTNDATGLTKLDGTVFPLSKLNPGQNATIHFNGERGQKVSASVSHATYGGCPAFRLALLRPDGSAFGNHVNTCTADAFLDAQALDQTGVWSILVDPQSDAVGTARLQAWDATDATKPINLNGAPINATLDPGQNGVYTFDGTSGQQLSATITNASITGCPGYRLALLRPDGTVFGAPAAGCGATAFLDSLRLDGTGTWALEIDPVGDASGTATLSGFTFADDDQVADLSGKPSHLKLTQPGQNARRTFAGTTGEKISAYVTDAAFTDCGYTVALVRPDGSTLAKHVDVCSSTTFLDAQTLDQNGTWTVRLDPVGTDVGKATLQLFQVDDESQSMEPGPDIKTFTSQTPGTNAAFLIRGATGDARTVTITGSTYEHHSCPAIVITFTRPDGSVLRSARTCGSSLTLSNVTFDQSGTWTLFIDPVGPATGTMVIRLT